jgi:potassium-transporting ATPase ATP-binding subunit
VFLLVVATLQPFAIYSGGQRVAGGAAGAARGLIPTTIGALLSAIGIAGMDRLVQRNVLALSGRAVEAAGDCNVLLLDKTGTITFGNRMASRFLPVEGVDEAELADAAQLASLADETPEGRSIVVLAKERFDLRGPELHEPHHLVPFTAETRMSGVDLDGRQIRKGAADAIRDWVHAAGRRTSRRAAPLVDELARAGSTPLVVADSGRVLGVIATQGRRQAGHPVPVRPAAVHGHPHGHDHRRQPADRGGHRRGGRGRRLPGRGHPRGQDGS